MIELAHPLALLLLLPGAALLWLHRRRGAVGLPGDWARLIERPLRSFVAGRAVLRAGASVTLPVVIWGLLVLAIARPGIALGTGPEFTNIAGRVIALDLGAGVDINRQRHAAAQVLEMDPGMPTALVLVTGDAFDVVPLTRDRAFLGRYLNVVSPDVMPVEGRSPAIALAHAEAILTRAGIVAGQVVLITGGPVPDRSTVPPAQWLRAVVVRPEERDAWEAFAAGTGARLIAPDDLSGIGADLQDAVASARRQLGSSGRLDLTPILAGIAAALWLLLFRRRRAA